MSRPLQRKLLHGLDDFITSLAPTLVQGLLGRIGMPSIDTHADELSDAFIQANKNYLIAKLEAQAADEAAAEAYEQLSAARTALGDYLHDRYYKE